ncbi:MAG: ChbG/HpnK family deacetylase [Patescibacteria group bacterium]|nr:ChbG/HpnK family deacetylase [Patescibacteria group bacterium]
MRKLIINADDYGLSDKFNRGILELIEKRIVTSTTVMVNKKFIKPKDLLKHKNISVGLHLDLSFESSTKDIENQIRKFKILFGRLPSHLDSHKYFHLLHSNFPKVLKIAKKYKLPVRSTCPADRKVTKRFKIKTPDQYISWHPARKNKLFSDLKNTRAGITELLCHPGYFDPKAIASYNKQRGAELKILRSLEFKKDALNFDLISYRDL